MKLWDKVTQDYFETMATGKSFSNGEYAQTVVLLDENGDQVALTMDGNGNLNVNVNGVNFTGNVTVEDIKLKNVANNEINPATEDKQTQIYNLLNNISTGNLKVNPNRKLLSAVQNLSTHISAAAQEYVSFTPPAGYLMKIRGINIECVALTGAGSGNQTVYIKNGGDVLSNNVKIVSDYNHDLIIRGFAPYTYDTLIPNSIEGIVESVKGMLFSNTYPLQIVYYNNTNVSTTNTATARAYRVLYELVPETTF